ncbi:DUF2399 domain-containing protein [Antribacter gilvus]|uniref:DUF2399 domain-containing protein n=1 Tax=Antribacter gilvus TaxID=2304675 RepID=UPI000F79DB24|nr:DUF2399 domain-containing protein [Antribacter gilvus]
MNDQLRVTGEYPLPGHAGVPDGLRAHARPTQSDGTFAYDRNDIPKVRRVALRAHPGRKPQRPAGLLTDTQWRWATSAPRLWRTVVSELGDRAGEVAIELARAGCIALEHDYRAGSIAQLPRRWIPHPDLVTQHTDRRDQQRSAQHALNTCAEQLSALLTDEWPGVATALTTPTTEVRLTWLVRAAEDLMAGRSHDGPRAFVQHHVGKTKEREDLTRLLADAGFEQEALAELGVNRNPYIGLGGPVRAHYDGRVLDWTGWPGPHDIRLPGHRDIRVEVQAGTEALVVIENRQAAETICDTHPDLAVVWCHGQVPEQVLRLINQAAETVRTVVICPDADLGGVRIASRIHDNLPVGTDAKIVDIGMSEHAVEGEAFGESARDQLAVAARRDDAVGHFARACLERGYAIEQEAPARAAIETFLRKERPRWPDSADPP